jgi:hypothetical protein
MERNRQTRDPGSDDRDIAGQGDFPRQGRRFLGK